MKRPLILNEGSLMLSIDKNQKSSIFGNMLYPRKHWGQSYIAIGVGCLRANCCKSVVTF